MLIPSALIQRLVSRYDIEILVTCWLFMWCFWLLSTFMSCLSIWIEERRLALSVLDALLHHSFLYPLESPVLSTVCYQDGTHFAFQSDKVCNGCACTLILHFSLDFLISDTLDKVVCRVVARVVLVCVLHHIRVDIVSSYV